MLEWAGVVEVLVEEWGQVSLELIECLLSGRPQRELARDLNVSEEYLSRTHKASLVRLVTEKLRIVTAEGTAGTPN